MLSSHRDTNGLSNSAKGQSGRRVRTARGTKVVKVAKGQGAIWNL